MELWDSSIGAQMGISALIVHAIEFAKKRDWFPFLDFSTVRANRIVSRVLAAATAVGLTFAVQGSFTEGGSITMQFPPATELLAGVIRYYASVFAQDVYYHTAVARNPVSVTEGK